MYEGFNISNMELNPFDIGDEGIGMDNRFVRVTPE